MNPEKVRKLLAAEIGLSLSEDQVHLLLRHLELVIEKNRQINLTSINDFEEGVYLHILDSLAVVPELCDAPEGIFIDVGTGGGYPGIPLGIATRRRGLLADSVRKKANAVRGFIDVLGLRNLSVSELRAEQIALTQREAFSAVVARAVARLGVLVELASPLLAQGGVLLAMKGNPEEEEMEHARGLERQTGMRLETVREIELGPGRLKRSVIVFKKIFTGSLSLPRRPGMATKRPL